MSHDAESLRRALEVAQQNVGHTVALMVGAWLFVHGGLDIVDNEGDAELVHSWALTEWPDQLAVFEEWRNERDRLEEALRQMEGGDA